jgi:agmatine/peptidylarginine deiminase
VNIRFPPEWAPQCATLLTWPHDQGDWGDKLSSVEKTFLSLVEHISPRQMLVIVCNDDDQRAHVRSMLDNNGVDMQHVELYTAPSNDVWSRDHGPISVFVDSSPRLLDFRFDGWGGKYPADKDDHITSVLQAQNAFPGIKAKKINKVLEGGSIDTDGLGTILTTEKCLLNSGRNPGMDRAAIEKLLRTTLGADRLLWLTSGCIAGDDTDSHIDTLARFCAPDVICYSSCDDPSYPCYEDLRAMENELLTLKNTAGQAYQLVPLPIPCDVVDDRGQLLPATYTNFLLVNGAALVPVYAHANDAYAVSILSECFPDREILPVNALPLLSQFGSLHCATMHFPAGFKTW